MPPAHPFGKENEVSVKLLLKFFCNNVYLGQWELARACVEELHKQRQVCPRNIKDLLRDIVSNPYGYCQGSPSVQCPQVLSWLAYQEYEQLEDKGSKKNALKEDLEFRLLLVQTPEGTSPAIVEELLAYHKHTVGCRLGVVNHSTSVSFLSSQCQAYLCKTLLSDPLLGNHIVRALWLPENLDFDDNNSHLLGIHLQCLRTALQSMTRDPANSDTFFSLLSLFDPSEETAIALRVSDFLRDLSKYVENAGSDKLCGIYSALAGHNSPHLLNQFAKLHHESQMGSYKGQRFDMFDTSLGVLEQTTLALATTPPANVSYIHLYWMMLKDERHFLEVIVDTSLELVKQRRYDELASMLEQQAWQSLKPLILLLAWDHCTELEDARSLLSVLLDQQLPDNCPLLQPARRLEYQLDLLQWCLERARTLGHGDENKGLRAPVLFHSLESQSVLQMLYHCGLLFSLEQTEVFEMLEKMPTKSLKDSSKFGKKEKSVRFADEESDPENGTSTAINLTQEKDISLYRSYCALKCFTDALSFCKDSFHWQILKSPKYRREEHRSSKENEQWIFDTLSAILENKDETGLQSNLQLLTLALQDLQKVYDKRVSKLLEEGRDHLSRLLPLNYRVEVLENVFALLFTTYEDVLEPNLSDSGEDGVTSSRNTSRQTSRENLSSLGSVASEVPSEGSPFLSTGEESSLFTSYSPTQEVMPPVFNSSIESHVFTHAEDVPFTMDVQTRSKKFSLTKSELKQDSTIERKMSGILSGNSISSVTNNCRSFIANEFFIRDLLITLKECMGDLNKARFALKGQSIEKAESVINPELEKLLGQAMSCSVEAGDLQGNISHLQKYISEAQWRFQLVAHDWLPSDFGKVIIDLNKLKDHQQNDEDFYGAVRGGSKRRRKRKRVDSKQSGESSLSTGDSESVAGTTDESMTDPATSQSLRQHITKLDNAMLQQLAKVSDGVVCDMLATPTDLLHSCLKRGKYTQAEQVVKMFHMQDEEVSAEVTFAVQYCQAVRKLQSGDSKVKFSRSISSPVTGLPSRPKLGLMKPSLSAIANVAAAGIANVSSSSIVDQVLSVSSLPGVGSRVELDSYASPLTAQIRGACIPAMVILDLACSTCRSWDSSLSFLDMALTRFPQSTTPTDPPEPLSSQPMMGINSFIHLLAHLIKLGSSASAAGQVQQRYFKRSLTQILMSGTIPIQVGDIVLSANLMTELERGLQRVDRAYADQRLYSSLHVKQDTKKLGKTVTMQTKPAVRMAMKMLCHMTDSIIPQAGLANYLLRRSREADPRLWRYLPSLYDYVKFLSTMVLELQGKPTGSKDMTDIEYFKVLEESPTEILGKLIFHMNIPPKRIEEMVSSLGINLPQVILNACCPNVPVKMPSSGKSHKDSDTKAYKEVHGRRLLNNVNTTTRTSKHPEILVREILTKLLVLMKEKASLDNPQGLVTLDVAVGLCEDPQVWDILSATKDLHSVNLHFLLDRENKLSFYGNLVNLLTLHSYIVTLQENLKKCSPFNCKFGSSSGVFVRSLRLSNTEEVDIDTSSLLPSTDLDWVLHEDKWAYSVGQLGIVSLFELKHLILRAGLPHVACQNYFASARFSDLDVNDPWKIFGSPMEPRMTFLISEGHLSSPPLQVLSPEMVTSQLRISLREYLHSTIAADTQTKVVVLPQLLVWYRADFVSEGRKDAKEYECLLEFVSSQLEGSLATDLNLLLNSYSSSPSISSRLRSGVQVMISPFTMNFGVTFSYEQFRQCQPAKVQTHKRRNSLQLHIRSLSSISSSNGDDKADSTSLTMRPDKALFQITSSTIDYLTTSSGDLVATLASLVSSDGSEGSLHTPLGNHYGEGSATPSAMHANVTVTSKDIQEFRYNRLKHFSPLQRHLVYHVLPLQVATESSLQGEDVIYDLTRTCLTESCRETLLLSPAHKSYAAKAMSLLLMLASNKQWHDAVKFLHQLPQATVLTNGAFTHLHDFILCCAANTHEDCSARQRSQYANEISDPLTRVRCVLSLLPRLPVDLCVSLLQLCKDMCPSDTQLCKTLADKLKHMKVYQKITECARLQQTKAVSTSVYSSGSLEDTLVVNNLDRLLSWQGIILQSAEDPDSVMDMILLSHDFPTARSWARIHGVRDEIYQIIEEKYITHLLDKERPEYLKAYQVLERVKAEHTDTCLKVCEDLLVSLENKENVLFVAQFMLTELAEDDSTHRGLSPSREAQLRLLIIGCKMVLYLPEDLRSMYEHLIASPNLLLEQLLMNMKIDYIGKILQGMTSELKCADEDFNLASCDTLLVKYATKALEFSVCKTSYDSSSESGSGTLSRCHSRQSLLSVTSVSHLTSGHHLSTPVALVSPPRSIQVVGKMPLGGSTDDTSYTITASSSRRFPRSESTPAMTNYRHLASPGTTPKTPVGSFPSHSPGAVTPGRKLMSSAQRAGYSVSPQLLSANSPASPKFTMPAEPPTPDQWVPDDAVTLCMVCLVERFSMFNRRHHCRRCGRVVCSSCSTHTTQIKGTSARTCNDCYNQICRSEGHMTRKVTGTPLSEGTVSRLGEIAESPDTVVGLSAEYQYILVLDDELNEAIREEFYYEQAPSTSLALSVLDLLSDQRDCGHVILTLVDDMSKLLQPLAPGISNPEVDYSLIISMLKYLLFHAKVKLQKLNDIGGVEQCDQYLGRLDLLKLLVQDNCSYIPSMQQLTKVEVLRRLRDKLIEEERLGLAMEMSTKCGIDPTGVWAAWGMTSLTAGDLQAARDKFSKCLKNPKDKNQALGQPKLLNDIINFIETHSSTLITSESVLSPLSSMSDLLADPPQVHLEEGQMDEVVIQECLYYLNSYGNHLSVVTFYMKHQRLHTALHYCKEMGVNSDVFVEGVIVNALQQGHLSKVLEAMVHVDPTLEQWSSYLNATCRHLNKNKLVHTLYSIQVFMKDFIRAAMTCITYFYQAGASSYGDLASRLQHLLGAKQHLESYLADRQWGAVLRAPGAGTRTFSKQQHHPDSLRMIMTPGEVNKYVNTISLQIEVTKFLHHYIENLEVVMVNLTASATAAAATSSPQRVPSQDSKLPTLFGSTKTKTEVVQLILLSGNNINDGFGLAFRIIQDFKLDSTSIYVKAARYFAHFHQYQSVRQLLSCIQDSGLCTDMTYDEVLTSAIEKVSQQPSEAKEAEVMIKLIRSDSKRIQAYIKCGKLKSAYLIAVKRNDEPVIQLIARHAEKQGQAAVKSICDKWLQQRHTAP